MEPEFWKLLETEKEIGSVDALPYIRIVDGYLTEFPILKPDGSSTTAHCLFVSNDVAPMPSADLPSNPALILLSIYLPDNLQRQGIGTRIIHALEKRAEAENKIFAIGSIMEDAMLKLCKKLGLTGCTPFSCYRRK